jgi:hypothetical protein
MNGEARPPHQVDLEHPWVGLDSFSDEARGYFFGRDAEVAELLQRLRLDSMLVLFGSSGLGKTSLLRARLVPKLEKLGDRPALYRIRYRAGEKFLDQLLVALEVWGNSMCLVSHCPKTPRAVFGSTSTTGSARIESLI